MFVNHPLTQGMQQSPQTENQKQQQKDLNLRIIEAESSLGYENPYLFLRSTWKMRSDPNASLDDRFDRLNKIVGMVKSSVKVSTMKEIVSQQTTVSYQDLSSRQAIAIEKMNRAQMQKQEFLSRLIQLHQQNEDLRKANSSLKSDMEILRKQKHELLKVNKDLMKKNIEIENKFLQNSLRISKIRQKPQCPQSQSFLQSDAKYSIRAMKEQDHQIILGEILPNFRQNILTSPEKSQKFSVRAPNQTSQDLSEKQNSFLEGGKVHVPRTNLMREKSYHKLRFKSRNGHQSMLESPTTHKFIRTNKFHSKCTVSGFQS